MTTYKITGIPALVIVEAKTGFKVSHHARKDISSDADIPAIVKSWDKVTVKVAWKNTLPSTANLLQP